MVQPRIATNGFKRFTLAQIRTILEGYGYDAEQVEEKVKAIAKERAALKGLKLKQTRSVTYWRYLRTPLKREIEIAKSSLDYIKRKEIRGEVLEDADVARREAYEAYTVVLSRLLTQFDVFVELNPSMTPTQVLNQEQDRGKWRFVTKGEHWADWVPLKARAPVLELFAAVPYRKQAKTKVPFERKIPKASQRSRRTMLEGAMAKELETLQAKHAAYEASPGMSDALLEELQTRRDRIGHKIRQIKRAQARLHEKRDNTPFPITWHGLLNDEEIGDE